MNAVIAWAAAVALAVVTQGPPSQAADLRIAYNSAWAPYSYGDGDAVEGLLVDLLDEIVHVRLGYDAAHVGFPWSRVQKLVEAGEADAFITFPSEERLAYAVRSAEDVFRVEARAVAKRDSEAASALRAAPGPETIRRHRVCVMLGDDWSERFFRQRDIRIDQARDTEQCLKMIARGREDLFIHTTETVVKGVEATGLGEALELLPHVYSSIPLTLLVSKRSRAPADLLRRFDQEVRRMRESGDLAAMIDRLRRLDR